MNTTSATSATGWTPDAANVPVTHMDAARVAAFIAAHKLEPWVELAVRLARESFPAAKAIQIYMFGGPDDEEYGERLWVEAATDVQISVDEWLRQDRNCAKRWLAATPPWVTDLMNIAFKPA